MQYELHSRTTLILKSFLTSFMLTDHKMATWEQGLNLEQQFQNSRCYYTTQSPCLCRHPSQGIIHPVGQSISQFLMALQG